MTNESTIRFLGYQLDPAARSLQYEGRPVALGAKTLDLLLYLARHPHQLVTKEQLLSAIWPDSFVEESNLSQHVFLLRKALAAAGNGTQIVVTVPGKGYQFAAAVDPSTREPVPVPRGELVFHAVQSVTRLVVEEETENESPPLPPIPARLPLPRKRRSWKSWTVAAALLVLAAAASLLMWKRLHPDRVEHIDLVLSDIQNSTGDPDFDRTLNQALLIDLEQSPFLNLLTRSRIQETLTEMQRKGDEAVTPALAMEVCERMNAQAMMHGAVTRLGSKYVLLLDADSCVSGKQIAGYKAEAASKEDVLRALDKAVSRVRHQLGESAASLERYQIPTTQATTPSLDALRAFSEAGESFRHGDMKAAQILLNRATQLDPGFASAYRALGSTYYNLGDYNQAAQYYKKAFDLRERTTERERLGIEVMYYGYGLNDYEQSIRRTQQLLQIYPNATNSWVSLSNLYDRLGQYPQALDAAARASRLDPQSSVATVELARSYLKSSRFAEARQVAGTAIQQGKDHWDVHSILFQIAFFEQDEASRKQEGEWGLTHQHANTSLCDMGLAAATEGKLREASDDLDRARDAALRDGEADFAEGVLLHAARVQLELDEPAQAAATLKRIKASQGDPSDPGELAFLRASTGDVVAAQRFAEAAEAGENHNTVTVNIYVPLLRALLALKSHKPEEAVRLLEPARVYQLRDFNVPTLRAQAEVEAGMLAAAANDYQLILDNPGVDPISPLYPLAHLRLARVLALEKKPRQARAEYQAFLDAWKNADPDRKFVPQARHEMADLH